jgi:hypothetical protein
LALPENEGRGEVAVYFGAVIEFELWRFGNLMAEAWGKGLAYLGACGSGVMTQQA